MYSIDCVPLLALTRGELIESIHYGAFVVVDRHGRVIASMGNQELLTYPRSSMKPLQALPFIERNGDQYFDLNPKEVAIICASHSGTDTHVEVLKAMHQKIGIGLNDLMCGIHWPSDKKTAELMRIRGEKPNSYRHNCSGKHTGMLAHAKMRSLPLENYLSMDHPVQQTILKTIAEMCGIEAEHTPVGVDGCSAPVFAIQLRSFAMGIARLCDPEGLDDRRAEACKRITHAMSSFPDMVAGPGRFDTVLMNLMQGKVIAKAGAEGYQCIGVLPDAFGEGSPALGIAIKISDGDLTRRAINCVSVSILNDLGLFGERELDKLASFGIKALKNWRGIVVGEMKTFFSLSKLNW